MGDVAKWVLLTAAMIALVGIILGFPIIGYMNPGVFGDAISVIVSYAGSGFVFARGLINNFLSSWGRSALSGLMLWLVGKWLVTYSLKVMVWVYQFIFK